MAGVGGSSGDGSGDEQGEVATYLAEHRLVQRVHSALNHAVRVRAPNPLLHMARELRAGQPRQGEGGGVDGEATAQEGSDGDADGMALDPSSPATLEASAEETAEETAECSESELRPSAESPSAESPSAESELQPSSESELRQLLEQAGSDPFGWEPHALPQLLKQLQERSVQLCGSGGGGGSGESSGDSSGVLRRVEHAVEIELWSRGLVLIETHRQQAGETRRRFALPRAQLRAGESWQSCARRCLSELLHLPPSAYSLCNASVERDEGAEEGAAATYPSLECEAWLHCVRAELGAESNLESNLGGALGAARFCTLARGSECGRLHWAWWRPDEWLAARRKRELGNETELHAAQHATQHESGEVGEPTCARLCFDGVGDDALLEDDAELGSAAAQRAVLCRLFSGCSAVYYHSVAGGTSRAKVLYVQAVDGAGGWRDPMICKLSSADALRIEADAHAAFARFIGESVPQRLGEQVWCCSACGCECVV